MSISPIRTPDSDSDPDPPVALHARAMDNLVFIRRTMESSGRFTALSGMGGILLGLTGFAGAVLAPDPVASPDRWLTTWLVAAVVGMAVAGWAVLRKARRAEVALFNGPGRKFVLGFVPALSAGAVLTWVLHVEGMTTILPGMWLLLYGVGVVTAGMFSERILPLMGLSFMVTGILALLAPPTWGTAFMVFGFGGVHIVCGAVITRRYGG